MKAKVARLTKSFFNESCGNEKTAAELMSNFEAQRAVQPFVFRDNRTDLQNAAKNMRDTVIAIKQHSSSHKAGTPQDILRRSIITASASGKLSPRHKVCAFFFLHFAFVISFDMHLNRCRCEASPEFLDTATIQIV